MALGWLENLGTNFAEQALGYGVGQAVSGAVTPFVQSLVNEAWTLNQAIPISPAELADMVVQGVKTEADAATEATMSGLNPDRFHELVLVNGSPPGPQDLLSMWDRGIITEDQVRRGLLQSRLKPEWVDAVIATNPALLSISDLANMVVQGVLTQAEGEAQAAKLSFSAEQFDRLTLLAGNPPGPQQMIELWQRGKVSESDLDKALLQSRLKPEWVETYKLLAQRVLSVSEAVDGVLRERLTEAQGRAIAAENGLDAASFDQLVDQAGRPIATGEALTLVKRGEMTAAQFREVIARSDVRAEYTDQILELATVYPSLYQVKQILSTGAITDAQATEILQKEGYTDAVVKGTIAAAHSIKLAGSKQLTQAAIGDLYQAKEIDPATATQLLEGLGYDDHDSALLLGYWDYVAAKTYRDAVVSIVKARYLQSDIDDATASGLLNQVGLAPDAVTQYLQLWAFDVQANPHLLTLAELNALVKKGLWTVDQYAAYLPRLLYQQPEIDALVALYGKG